MTPTTKSEAQSEVDALLYKYGEDLTDVQHIKFREAILRLIKDFSEERLSIQRWLLRNIKTDDNDCWVWQKNLDNKGYARHEKVYEGVRYQRMQRLSFAVFERTPDPKLVLDHLCRNRPCINPDHLEEVTNGENVLRGEGVTAQHAKKTHCPRGHEYNEENTYIFLIKSTNTYGRMCRKCNNARVKKFKKARLEELSTKSSTTDKGSA